VTDVGSQVPPSSSGLAITVTVSVEHLQVLAGIVIGVGMNTVEVRMPTVTVTVFLAVPSAEYVPLPLLNEEEVVCREELVGNDVFLVDIDVTVVTEDSGMDVSVNVDWGKVSVGVHRPVLLDVGVKETLSQEKPELCVHTSEEPPDEV
jgi:hypothetical protein